MGSALANHAMPQKNYRMAYFDASRGRIRERALAPIANATGGQTASPVPVYSGFLAAVFAYFDSKGFGKYSITAALCWD